MVPIKKQLYATSFYFTPYVKILTNFIGCIVSKVNFLSFTCHFSNIFNHLINLYEFLLNGPYNKLS